MHGTIQSLKYRQKPFSRVVALQSADIDWTLAVFQLYWLVMHCLQNVSCSGGEACEARSKVVCELSTGHCNRVWKGFCISESLNGVFNQSAARGRWHRFVADRQNSPSARFACHSRIFANRRWFEVARSRQRSRPNLGQCSNIVLIIYRFNGCRFSYL